MYLRTCNSCASLLRGAPHVSGFWLGVPFTLDITGLTKEVKSLLAYVVWCFFWIALWRRLAWDPYWLVLQVEPGHTVLVQAAAGGVGSLLCQWANALGATVIGTVSTTEKAAQAKDDGCHHVILYKEEDFVTRVKEITSGKGVEAVYDSVGKDTFEVIDFFLKSNLLSNWSCNIHWDR